jgi:hypothetical protein
MTFKRELLEIALPVLLVLAFGMAMGYIAASTSAVVDCIVTQH